MALMLCPVLLPLAPDEFSIRFSGLVSASPASCRAVSIAPMRFEARQNSRIAAFEQTVALSRGAGFCLCARDHAAARSKADPSYAHVSELRRQDTVAADDRGTV